jgi:hypothetical protein
MCLHILEALCKLYFGTLSTFLHVRFEVPTVVKMSMLFSVVTPCKLVGITTQKNEIDISSSNLTNLKAV